MRDTMAAFKQTLFASTLPTAALFAGTASLGAIAAKADGSFVDFFEQGKFLVDARYRFEHVDQDGLRRRRRRSHAARPRRVPDGQSLGPAGRSSRLKASCTSTTTSTTR